MKIDWGDMCMAERIGWDKYEIALLIDACERVVNEKITKAVIVKELSTQLRQRAVNRGLNIDPLFRNENGIALQMNKMDYFLSDGKRGLPGGSKYFAEIAKLRKKDPVEYESILTSAYENMQTITPAPAIRKTIDKSLLNAGLTIPKAVVSCFLNQLGVDLDKGESCEVSVLIDGITYPAKITNIKFSEKYAETNMVQLRYSTKSELCRKLNEIFADAPSSDNSDKPYVEIFVLGTKLLKFNCVHGKKPDPKVQKAATTHSNIPKATILSVDWDDAVIYAGTKPVAYKYKNLPQEDVDNWSELYISLMKLLVAEYPQKFRQGLSLSSGMRIDIGSTLHAQKMIRPREIKDGIYLETNMSANDIIRRIKSALGLGNIQPTEVEIKYTKDVMNKADNAVPLQKSVPPTPEIVYSEHAVDRVSVDDGFAVWMKSKGMADATVRSYVSSIRSAEAFAKEHSIPSVELTTGNVSKVLSSIDALLSNKPFIQYNQDQHNRFSAAFRKMRDYIAEIDRHEKQSTNDTEMELRYPALYRKLVSVSKVYDDPNGLTVERIAEITGFSNEFDSIVEVLDSVSWSTKLASNLYSFANNTQVQAPKRTMAHQEEPTDFDKDAYISVLLRRFPSGMQFDSIDMENFRDTYSDLFDNSIAFNDAELEHRLRYCGVLYKDRLFPAEGIIDSATGDRLFSYIESKFAAGNSVLYYKAIFSDLADAFAYCFSLTDENMLKAYIEYKAEPDKFFFHDSFISVEKEVEIDHAAEIADFMLAAGKPLSYEEVYAGLSHISQDIIYKEIHWNPAFARNEKEHYFHMGIFEFSEDEEEKISSILNQEIEENGYAIWSHSFITIQDTMPNFLENNLYLSSLGIREALARKMQGKFSFDGEVISTIGEKLSMADVYRLYAKHHTPFSDEDVYNFSKELGTVIYFWSLAQESVRVSRNLFVAKDQIVFDIDAVDKALETYLPSGYILAKDVDSFLVFPNVGYEWNEFLLESFLLHYSEKFCLVNNGTSLNNVAGAIAKKDGEFTQFVDICAHELAQSGIELKKATSLDYLAKVNLITRRSYKEIDVAMTKARQLRNGKE